MEATDPEGLKGILPPFSSSPFLPPSSAEGWGPVRISPTGKFFLVERTAGTRRSVHLLDREGTLVRGFASADRRWSSAQWGPSDLTFYMECRDRPNAPARYVKVERTTDKERPSPIKGLARWSATGQDYLLPLTPRPREAGAGRYQRFTLRNTPTGAPLGSSEPVWSPNGRLLAFATERPRPAELTEAEWPPVRELRVIPARGEVARVVLSRAAWTKLIQENGWKWASGPESLAWSPRGDALFGVITVRTGSEERRYLLRMDLGQPQRKLQLLDNTTHLVTASADGRHWLVEMDTGFFRLDFNP